MCRESGRKDSLKEESVTCDWLAGNSTGLRGELKVVVLQ